MHWFLLKFIDLSEEHYTVIGQPQGLVSIEWRVYISNNKGWGKQRYYEPYKDVNIQHTLLD